MIASIDLPLMAAVIGASTSLLAAVTAYLIKAKARRQINAPSMSVTVRNAHGEVMEFIIDGENIKDVERRFKDLHPKPADASSPAASVHN